MNKAYNITITVPGGDPDGIRVIGKTGWNGSGITFPRVLLPEARKRTELDYAGVYVLSGPPEESGLPKIYVGEGDPIKPRLEQHASNKDFWTNCVAFSSTDKKINKTHVQYVEAKLVALAKQEKRCLLDNGNEPTLPTLDEADQIDAEAFLSEILLCLPVLGLRVFTGSAPINGSQSIRLATGSPAQGYAVDTSNQAQEQAGLMQGPIKTDNQTLSLSIKPRGSDQELRAQGMEVLGGFRVFAGSEAVLENRPSCKKYLEELRATLVANGVLRRSDKKYMFSQDYEFSSPSIAAAVVKGGEATGPGDWKNEDGKSLKDLREAATG